MIIRLALCVFMPRSELNDIFDLGEDYYSGYFSDTRAYRYQRASI